MFITTRFVVVTSTLALLLGFGLVHVLNRIGDNIHADALAAAAVQMPTAAPPPGELKNGAWRLEVYGKENCVWVRGHMQAGHWVEGYWRRKPRPAQ